MKNTHSPAQSPQEVDRIRAEIEAIYTPKFKKIFDHMAVEARTFFLAKGSVPAHQITQQFRPEFIKIMRDAQRAAIKRFGFGMRNRGEEKGYKFKTAKHEALIDFQLENKDEQSEITALLLLDDQNKMDKINQQFALDAAIFVNVNVEEQADYVDDTNEKEMNQAQVNAIFLYTVLEKRFTDQIDKLTQELSQERFNVILGRSPAISEAQKKKIQDKIKKLSEQKENLQNNKNKITADNIEKIIRDKGVARSELISSQNVGMAQSFAQNKEAQLIDQNIPEATIKKKWQAILDSRTRDTHVAADGQTVGVNAKFTVGGYLAEYPRDPSLPIDETANCRCVSFHYWE